MVCLPVSLKFHRRLTASHKFYRSPKDWASFLTPQNAGMSQLWRRACMPVVLVRRRTLTKVVSRLSGLLMAASLASAMTSAMTSAKTSSVTSVAAAAELTPNYYGSSTPYFALSWAGPYVGATLGYEWGSIDNNPTRPKGVAGGFETGFNWQNGNFVYGGEADISFPTPATPSRPGNSPIRGSARCVGAPASPSCAAVRHRRPRLWRTDRNDIGESVREP